MTVSVAPTGSATNTPEPPVDRAAQPTRLAQAQVSPGTVRDFVDTPSVDVDRFLGRIPGSEAALAAAFDARRANLIAAGGARPDERLTFQDRRFMASEAVNNQHLSPAERVTKTRVGATQDAAGTRTTVNVTTAKREHSAQLDLPSGFSAAVQPDNTVLLSRTDGGLMGRPFAGQDQPARLDHVVLSPHVGKDGTVSFRYFAGGDSSSMSAAELNDYLSRQPRRQ